MAANMVCILEKDVSPLRPHLVLTAKARQLVASLFAQNDAEARVR